MSLDQARELCRRLRSEGVAQERLVPVFEDYGARLAAGQGTPFEDLLRAAGIDPRPSPVPGYRVRHVLGEGAMGRVYAAEDEEGRDVALKVLRREAASANAMARFEREAEALRRVRHPNVVAVYDHGVHGDLAWIAMELVSGETLEARLAEERQPASRIARWVASAARAVHCAHELGIVHRDLKPGNMLLGEDDELRVTDFGLARDLDRQTRLTQSQDIVGTPGYLAPEQALGEHDEVGPATDVFALGVILYEGITGERPFRAQSLSALLIRIVEAPATHPCEVDASAPAPLAAIAMKALAKRPGERYASAQALAEDIERAVAGLQVKAAEGGLARALKRPGLLACAGVLLAAALASPWLLGLGRDLARRRERAAQGARLEARLVALGRELQQAAQAAPGERAARLDELLELEARIAGFLEGADEAAAALEVSLRHPAWQRRVRLAWLAQSESLRVRDPAGALEAARQAWRVSPEGCEERELVLATLVEALRASGALDEASRRLNEQPELSPRLLLARGRIAREQGRLPAALADFAAAAESPELATPSLKAELAELRVANGEVEAGLAALEALTQRQPESAELWLWLGRARASAGLAEPALAAFETARRLDDERDDILLGLVDALVGAGRRAAARALLHDLRGVSPELQLAQAQLALEDGDAAGARVQLATLKVPSEAGELGGRVAEAWLRLLIAEGELGLARVKHKELEAGGRALEVSFGTSPPEPGNQRDAVELKARIEADAKGWSYAGRARRLLVARGGESAARRQALLRLACAFEPRGGLGWILAAAELPRLEGRRSEVAQAALRLDPAHPLVCRALLEGDFPGASDEDRVAAASALLAKGLPPRERRWVLRERIRALTRGGLLDSASADLKALEGELGNELWDLRLALAEARGQGVSEARAALERAQTRARELELAIKGIVDGVESLLEISAQRRVREAIAMVDELQRLEPFHPLLRNLRGTTLLRQANAFQASLYFAESHLSKPYLAMMHLEIQSQALSFLGTKDIHGTIAETMRGPADDAELSEAERLFAQATFRIASTFMSYEDERRPRPDIAEEVLREVERIRQLHADAMTTTPLRAYALLRLGRGAEAEAEWERMKPGARAQLEPIVLLLLALEDGDEARAIRCVELAKAGGFPIKVLAETRICAPLRDQPAFLELVQGR